MTPTTRNLARPLATPPPRYDALAQFNEPAAGPAWDVRGAVRTFWAFGLAAAGVGIAMWLVILIHAAVFEPQTVGLFDRLRPNTEDLALTLPAGNVQLPTGLMTVIGYLFLILLTTIAARMAVMMIRHGVSLLRQDPPTPEKPEPEPDVALPPLASQP